MTNMTEHCGFIAIVGRPNVGKSTLLNHILGTKLSITSRRPQTTRERILGVKTEGEHQFVFIDTPGVYATQASEMDRCLQESAMTALKMVDLILFVVEVGQWKPADIWLYEQVEKVACPRLLVVNKIDRLDDPVEVLPFIEAMQERVSVEASIPVSALRSRQVDVLLQAVKQRLPEHPFCFPPDQITDRSDVFYIAETVREKIFRILGQELPYAMAVSVDAIKEQPKHKDIFATIWVEKESQKAIVIGQKGARIKQIGTQARVDIEAYLKGKINLQLWVKVKRGWTKNKASLQAFGIDQGDR